MPPKTVVDVPGLPDSSGYSYVQCITAGDFIFVAGQTGVNEKFEPVSDDFEEQTRQTFRNVELALQAAGAELGDLVAMTVSLTDMRYSADFTRIRGEILGDVEVTSAMIGVDQLWAPNILVEVQATAVKP